MSRMIHQFWVGPRTPQFFPLASWERINPKWGHTIWGNPALEKRAWITKERMDIFREREQWCGVVDLMRLEVLYERGGLYLDGDMIAAAPLPDNLPDQFLVWEHETAAPGLIANGAFRVHMHNAFICKCLEVAQEIPLEQYKTLLPWQVTGPTLFTNVYGIMGECNKLPILPSRTFFPVHHTGEPAPGDHPNYATHMWYSTEIAKRGA